jgi:quinol-cytochrome oxidoreductase complex cytochrome b subunit
MRLTKIPLLSILNNHLVDYPTPINISYLWGFGSLAGFCLMIQMITGVCLAMHYTPHVDLAFNSVEHIMRDVNHGWLLRYTHANGASMFFIVVYIHIGRGLYYTSYAYPRMALWYSGIIIFLLMMATAFMGYVLPWGQMSFWGVTVITNLFSAIPYVGKSIALWLWGGFSIGNATLNRFFSLHYLLPFLIVGLVIIHLALLHLEGSNNPLGICTDFDTLGFYPYFYLKDMVGLMFFLIVFAYIVYFIPNYLGHPDNYIKANALVTPTHIVPEWYFLPFYAILRAIPDKLQGVIAMGLSLIIYFIIPFIYTSTVKGAQFKPIFTFFFWFFIGDVLMLGWLGGQVAEEPFITCSQACTVYYFLYLTVILKFTQILEEYFIEITSIKRVVEF